ncbi:hypothetical protein EDD86DRAFT_245270 [Gorgonomyces haynaldii]|nr:hypothetical protein EDD86DRAFT_245270 [Gorgonomyces haynaldii]
MSFEEAGNALPMLLRMIDISLLGKKTRLDTKEYLSVWISGTTIKDNLTRSDWIRDINFRTLVSLLPLILFHLSVLAFLPHYLYTFHPLELKPFDFIHPFDFYRLSIYALHGLVLYSGILMGLIPLGLFIAYVLGIQYQWPFADLLSSTSLQQFWSRWNRSINAHLKRLTYDNTVPIFGKLLSTLFVFLFSGVLHDYTVYLFQGHTDWEQVAFFVLHAVLMIVEVIVFKLFKLVVGASLHRVVPKPILTVGVLWLILITSPLFLNSYLRNHVFDDIFSIATQ